MSKNSMIEGVKIKQLVTHPDERGYFREILRDDDGLIAKFGQTAVTFSYPGLIKAFHWHKVQYDVWYVATGNVRAVLYDRREDSTTFGQTQVIYAGETNPVLIVIPPGVVHGYQVLGSKPALLFYHTTESYKSEQPDEERLPFNDKSIGFDWGIRNR